MRGRYYRRSDKQWIAEHFRVHSNLPSWLASITFVPFKFLATLHGWGIVIFRRTHIFRLDAFAVDSSQLDS
jgi:hypothetical protein